jgi:16S rRNA (adenine1518-N6/adenine1519-N6)-dimethyltransferase
MGIKPLKRFGQNYLTDKNTIEKIVGKFSPGIDDSVIEIGPGQGALTEKLYGKVKNYAAVEIDNRVIETLQKKFPKVNFINQDFLKINFSDFEFPFPIRIIGNIPYNITAPIIFKLIENHSFFSDAMMMVQYEVAQRLIAKPRTKQYGILSVILNYFADVQMEFKISPNVFYPKPNVDSAIISVKFKNPDIKVIDEKQFIQLVKNAFSTRRKTLKNSLKNSIFISYLKNDSPFDLSKRAEELRVTDYVNLSNYISEKNAGN